ncbi:MAG: 50S ribosomal protein L11 methyltransferase, partial [Dehalococcoidia bacterium]
DDWAHAWKEFFPVLRVGRRLVIRPTWREHSPYEDDVVIHLDPGVAFGTGQHPTTRLCLQALEELTRAGMRVLDLGTGSGILAIAAAKLGATLVLALDIDPQATRAARENIWLNDVAEVVRAEEGSLGHAWPTHLPGQLDFDLAVANISALAVCDLAAALATVLKPRGLAVVSGFTTESADAVARCLEAAGLTVERTDAEGEWQAIIARRD